MSILGDATVVLARVTRSASNALRVELATPDGTELARAQQKGGAAVLFGFKNGGKGEYTLSAASGDELKIAVAGTTTITNRNTPVGKIVPADGAHAWKTVVAPCWRWCGRTPDTRPMAPGIIACCRRPVRRSVSSR
ncbi:MAG: hypothetical protein ACXVX6_11220 [Mycobacterium sp.]